jgi:hypothetical protein
MIARVGHSAAITMSWNKVRLLAAHSWFIDPRWNCMINPPTPVAFTGASFSATVAGQPQTRACSTKAGRDTFLRVQVIGRAPAPAQVLVVTGPT